MVDLQQHQAEGIVELPEPTALPPSSLKRIEIWSGRLAMFGITVTLVVIGLKG